MAAFMDSNDDTMAGGPTFEHTKPHMHRRPEFLAMNQFIDTQSVEVLPMNKMQIIHSDGVLRMNEPLTCVINEGLELTDPAGFMNFMQTSDFSSVLTSDVYSSSVCYTEGGNKATTMGLYSSAEAFQEIVNSPEYAELMSSAGSFVKAESIQRTLMECTVLQFNADAPISTVE